MILYRARKYGQALAACEKALELDPNQPDAYWFRAFAREQKREFPEAIADLTRAVSLSNAPLYRALLAHTYALAGQKAKAFSTLSDLQVLSKQKYVSPLDSALVYSPGMSRKRKIGFKIHEQSHGTGKPFDKDCNPTGIEYVINDQLHERIVVAPCSNHTCMECSDTKTFRQELISKGVRRTNTSCSCDLYGGQPLSLRIDVQVRS